MFDGMIYRNGETFQPSCKYQCTCRDGQIGCLPRCNLGLLLPGPDCPFPRKIEVPGECCEKWVCDPRDEVLLGGFAMAGEELKLSQLLGGEDDVPGLAKSKMQLLCAVFFCCRCFVFLISHLE